MTFPEICRVTNVYCLVVRCADQQVYYLDQCSFKWSIGTSKVGLPYSSETFEHVQKEEILCASGRN